MNTIQESWESFKNEVIPEDTSQTEIQNAQTAFYGGAISTLSILSLISCDETLSQDAAALMIEGLGEECRLFSEGGLNLDLPHKARETTECKNTNASPGIAEIPPQVDMTEEQVNELGRLFLDWCDNGDTSMPMPEPLRLQQIQLFTWLLEAIKKPNMPDYVRRLGKAFNLL